MDSCYIVYNVYFSYEIVFQLFTKRAMKLVSEVYIICYIYIVYDVYFSYEVYISPHGLWNKFELLFVTLKRTPDSNSPQSYPRGWCHLWGFDWRLPWIPRYYILQSCTRGFQGTLNRYPTMLRGGHRWLKLKHGPWKKK